MGIQIECVNEKTIFNISGELTIYTVQEYKDVILDKFTLNKKIDVDLSDIDEIDMSGLQLLSMLFKESDSNGIEINITSLNDVSHDAIKISQLFPAFNSNYIKR